MASTPAPTSDPTIRISPVRRAPTFAHRTSPAVSTNTPLINTDTPAINDAPIELPADSVHSPAEPPNRRASETEEERAEKLAQRAKDKGVIVNVPSEPTAEEVRMAESRGRGKVEGK